MSDDELFDRIDEIISGKLSDPLVVRKILANAACRVSRMLTVGHEAQRRTAAAERAFLRGWAHVPGEGCKDDREGRYRA